MPFFYFKKHTLFLLLVVVSLLVNSNTHLQANDWKGQLQQANEAYAQAKYDAAVDAYEAIYQNGYQSATLHYNLGNAYYRLNRIAPAILNYERAKKLAPYDKEISHNLNMVNKKITHNIDGYPVLFIKKWFTAVINFFSSSIWAILILLGVWGAMLLGVLFVKSANVAQKKRAFSGIIALLFFALLCFGLGIAKYQTEINKAAAIVFNPQLQLKNGPSDASADIIPLSEGVKVNIVEEVNGWVKILLNDGQEGWIRLKDLKRI